MATRRREGDEGTLHQQFVYHLEQCEEIARLLGIEAPVQPTGGRERQIRQVRARLQVLEDGAAALRRELAGLTSGTDKQRGLRLVK